MKTYKSIIIIAVVSCVALSCEQQNIKLTQPTQPPTSTPSKGTADFTNYVAIGNSLTAGMQAGALFNDGQKNSFPVILTKQFSLAQGTTLTCNQPDINSVNGYYKTVNGVTLGRLILFAASGNPTDGTAVPTPAGSPGVPAPYNSADPIGSYNGDKTKLNNLGAPEILLRQCLTPLTGGPTTGNRAYNQYYARFATTPGTSTIIADAIAKNPTFITFELGNNDVLGYAIRGGDGTIPITKQADFQTQYKAAIDALMANTKLQGVLVNIPSITSLPFFSVIPWNKPSLTAEQAAAVTTALAKYNAGLTEAMQQGVLTQAEVTQRTLTFTAGNNAILIADKTLKDLSPYMPATLKPYAQARQATKDDLITLTAGEVLGKGVGGSTTIITGVTYPLGDSYVLLPSEQRDINSAIDGFNAIINSTAALYPSNLAVADINSAFGEIKKNNAYISNGVMVTPNFIPPTGGFSEDGIHPNSRGYAIYSNVIIDAINKKFNANVPSANLADYAPVGFPVVPSK